MGDTHIYYSQHHNIITQHSPAKSATWLLIFPHNILNRLSFIASSDRAISEPGAGICRKVGGGLCLDQAAEVVTLSDILLL